MASEGIVPRATAVEPGAKMRAALGLACTARRSFGSVATMRFKSISKIKLPSGAIVVPGNNFTRRRYSPRFLITISSLPRTSSTTTRTASRQFRLHRRRRKSRMEQHFAKVTFRQPVRGFVRNQAALDRALLHAFVVDAASVVFHFDVNVIAAMIGAQGNFAFFGLSLRRANLRQFDSVRHGVAHQVHQRI